MLIKKGFKGFTLVELMIVVAIVGILAAIAYPSYRESVLKGMRSEGKAALLDLAQKQERFFTERNTYTTNAADLSLTDPINSSEGHYVLTIAVGPSGSIASSFTLTATVQQTDTKCGNLSLTSTNVKAASGGGTDCW